MTQIHAVSNEALTAIATNTRIPPASDGFATALEQAQQRNNPPSAYVPKPGTYSVETHGSHIVGGVQLIPGAPGYRQDLAAPYLKEIAGSDRELAAYLDQPFMPASPVTLYLTPAETPSRVIAEQAVPASMQAMAPPLTLTSTAQEELPVEAALGQPAPASDSPPTNPAQPSQDLQQLALDKLLEAMSQR